jgi:hypothetical protein
VVNIFTNINFLIGSGVSAPFLETLTDIEKQLSAAEGLGMLNEEIRIKKEYFKKSTVKTVIFLF